MPTSFTDVAQWMADELEREGTLYQEDAAAGISDTFGTGFVYFKENGNLAILKVVLAEFRRLTEGSVVWEADEKAWRKLGVGEKYEGRPAE